MMWLPDGRKSFKVDLAVLIQYWRVTSIHPASQPRSRSKDRAYVYVARIKTSYSVREGDDEYTRLSAEYHARGTYGKGEL